MNTTIEEICLKKLHGLVIFEKTESIGANDQIVASLNAEFMKLGYCMSQSLFISLSHYTVDTLSYMANKYITLLRQFKGADVDYTPMYQNFPEEVMEMSYFELYMNAILHYWTCGTWSPKSEKLPRQFEFEYTKFQEIGIVTIDQTKNIFTQILSSNDSISDYDKLVVERMMMWFNDLVFPKTIPFKENVCVVAGIMIKNGQDITPLIKTATDVLRVITYMNDGDISLASNTKFKSMPRSQRRMFAKILENVISEEDIHRHKNKWIKLFHSLHIGEYSRKVANIAKKARENKHLDNTIGQFDFFMKKNLKVPACMILISRPGEFARKLDYILRSSEKNIIMQNNIVSMFCEENVIGKVSSKVLLQLLGHFQNRNDTLERVVFPKGMVQRAIVLDGHDPLNEEVKNSLIDNISFELVERFKKLPSLGKCYIDEMLLGCPLPSQMRSANDSTDIVARGTRYPMGDSNTLRMFIHWIGQDIDLSCTLHDVNFKILSHIGYTNLKDDHFEACHSGDETRAPKPKGACEFIDITLDKLEGSGIKYAVMNVNVYSGPSLKEHEKVYAGWMMRSKPKSNEIFDPKTVVNKFDLTTDSRVSIPVIFDLETREVIYTDIAMNASSHRGGNNVHSNKAGIEQVLRAMVSLNKLNLYNLFSLHVLGRGKFTENKEEADTIFSLEDGITPRDINIINSEYIA